MELEIEYNGKKLQAVEVDQSKADSCTGCYFENIGICICKGIQCFGENGEVFIYVEVKEE